jgi:flagellar basal-body rod protein FlgB
MLPTLFDSSTLPVLEQVVNFTEARHGVLAGNIANLDTPGYRSRDLSTQEFQTQLQDALKNRQRSAAQSRAPYPSATSYGLSGATSSISGRSDDKLAAVTDTVKGMLRHDDNNASLEEQVTEIAKNQAQHNLALSLMTAQFRLLRAAITERA